MKHIPNLFLDIPNIEKELINNTEEYNHLINVLKLKESDKLNLLDNSGNIYFSEITDIQKKYIKFKINSKKTIIQQKNKISLVQSILKINTFEEILDKATQLGIDNIFPIITENTILKLDLFKSKYERFNKIIKSASEQSRRAFKPILQEPIFFKDFENYFSNKNTIIAFENSDIFMKNLLRNYKLQENNFLVCGPEGGFTNNEIDFFIKNNYPVFRITSSILRSETAIISILSNFLYEFNT